jgi:hypothetical protein
MNSNNNFNKSNDPDKRSWKYLKIGALIGAILGALLGFLHDTAVFFIPGIEHLIESMPFGIIPSSIILCVAVGCVVFVLPHAPAAHSWT